MSIKPIIQQINAKQQALEQGLKQMQTTKMRGIEAKADAFLTSSDPIGFIGRLASEAPDEIAPVVNAARRKKKEVMQAQAPQQENITTAGLRAVFELSRPQQQQPQQPPPNPRQMAVASLPMRPDMFKAGGGIVAFSGHDGSFVRQQRLAEAEKRRLGDLRNQVTFTSALLGQYPGTQTLLDSARTLPNDPNSRPLDDAINPVGRGETDPMKGAKPLSLDDIVKKQSEQKEVDDFYRRIGPQGPDISEMEIEKGRDLTDKERQYIEDFNRKQEEIYGKKEAPITREEPKILEQVSEKTTEETLVSNLEKARNILRPENVAKDGAIGQQVTDKESKLAEFKSLVDAGNAKAAAALEKEKAALAGDKKEAIYMGLLEIGLGIMGGDDPNAFVNIGKGAKAAFPSLAKSLQDVKDARRRVTDSEIKLAELENTRKIDLAKFDLDLYEKEQTRLANQQNAFLNAQVTLARALTEKDTREKVARLQVQGQKYAADKRASIEGATVQEIQRYADAKGIPYNQAADEVYRLKKSTNRADMISAFLQRGQTNQDGSVTLNKNVIQDFSQFGLEPTRPNT